MRNLRDIATGLASKIAALGPFELLSDGSTIPVFAFRLKDASRYSVFDVSARLRMRGWQVPAYTLPADAQHIAVLRIVVREGFSRDIAEMLLGDLRHVIDSLETAPSPPQSPRRPFPSRLSPPRLPLRAARKTSSAPLAARLFGCLQDARQHSGSAVRAQKPQNLFMNSCAIKYREGKTCHR